MTLKEYLIGLEWNSFSTYPEQGSCIYLHCSALDGQVHKFIKIQRFNAVKFDARKIVERFEEKLTWQFSWLPIESINEFL